MRGSLQPVFLRAGVGVLIHPYLLAYHDPLSLGICQGPLLVRVCCYPAFASLMRGIGVLLSHKGVQSCCATMLVHRPPHNSLRNQHYSCFSTSKTLTARGYHRENCRPVLSVGNWLELRQGLSRGNIHSTSLGFLTSSAVWGQELTKEHGSAACPAFGWVPGQPIGLPKSSTHHIRQAIPATHQGHHDHSDRRFPPIHGRCCHEY